SFFFQSSRIHPYLHSFPTRRSSDLQQRAGRVLPVEADEHAVQQRVGGAVSAQHGGQRRLVVRYLEPVLGGRTLHVPVRGVARREDRKSTRLNSSHLGISYAVFCLKK